METLGYGTHLIINGFHVASHQLDDPAQLERLVTHLAQHLEPGAQVKPETYSSDAPRGSSTVALLAESYVTLHTYSELGLLSLRLFSRHGLNTQEPVTLLRETLGLSRFESHLSNHGHTVSKDAAQRQKTVLGERQYTLLHLSKNVPF
jgi:S-adenosylmethionine/arginine decarboxylase-like enzyme